MVKMRGIFVVLMISPLFLVMTSFADENSAQAPCYDPGTGQPIPCTSDGPLPPPPPGNGTYIQGLPDDHDGDGTPDGADLCKEESGPDWNHGCPEGVDTDALLPQASTPEPTEEPFIPPTVNGARESDFTCQLEDLPVQLRLTFRTMSLDLEEVPVLKDIRIPLSRCARPSVIPIEEMPSHLSRQTG
jgi:hypothetical protein